MEGCDDEYPAFSHTIVFEKGLIPLQSVLNTDSDESWHTLCVQLLNVCLCLPLHTPRSFAQQRSMPKCTIIVSQLVVFYPMFFSNFSLDATLKMYTDGSHLVSSGLDNPSDLDLITAHAIIPQLTSDPVSNTHEIPIWSPPTLLYHNRLLIRSRTPIRGQE